MRKILYTIIIAAFSCCNNGSEQQKSDMPGVYVLLSKKIEGGPIDSVVKGINQLKIYTDNYFMYTSINSAEKVASFAIGSYTKDDSNLTEHVQFSTIGTSNIKPVDITFNVNKTQEGYNQTTKDTSSLQTPGILYTEKYKYAGTKVKTIIDGVWKQIETYSVKGTDTTWDTGTNFKICYDGYVMWGDFHINPATQKHDTYMGFGTFEMQGNNKLTEYYIKSNYTVNEGKTFYIDVEFRNKDEFKQTISDSLNGVRYIEVYHRFE